MFQFSPKKIFLGILGLIAVLLLLHIASYLHLLKNDLHPESFFFRKFNFDTERNVPSIFSGILHFTACILLAIIAGSHLIIRNRRWFWAALSFLFLFLGVDEIVSIHEKVTGNIVSLEQSGTFFYNWIVVYSSGAMLLGLVFFKPLISLPRKTLGRFIFAGVVFIFGATVLESIAGNLIFREGIPPEDVITTPKIFILATFEELFEMLGITLFIYALLSFITNYRKENIIYN